MYIHRKQEKGSKVYCPPLSRLNVNVLLSNMAMKIGDCSRKRYSSPLHSVVCNPDIDHYLLSYSLLPDVVRPTSTSLLGFLCMHRFCAVSTYPIYRRFLQLTIQSSILPFHFGKLGESVRVALS